MFAVPSKAAKAAKAEKQATGTLAQAPVDLNAKWDAYIAANAPKVPENGSSDETAAAYEKARAEFSESIAVEVAKLMKSDAASAAALIKSALRNDYAADWMYEALAAALIKANAPQKEIETAILSVADFNSDPIVLMGLAAYLEKVGSKERALKIYRDVSKVYPTRPEPYVRGLALAQELNDEEALKWVAVGIASVVWDGALVESVQSKGEEIALDLIDKMNEEGRADEAEEFQRQLKEASVRDVVVEVSWSGDAELDLSVQEPTNAVCWYAQKRTAAGGVLTDPVIDLRKSYEANREGVRSRVYTCPMGFAGEYNFLVTRSWGTVAQTKVTVTIKTNVGTDKERVAKQVFDLTNDEALFGVNLAEGRRNEEVKEDLLAASALMNHLQIRTSHELAQRAVAYQSRKASNDARICGDSKRRRPVPIFVQSRRDGRAEEARNYLHHSVPVICRSSTTSPRRRLLDQRRRFRRSPLRPHCAVPTFSQLLKMFTITPLTGRPAQAAEAWRRLRRRGLRRRGYGGGRRRLRRRRYDGRHGRHGRRLWRRHDGRHGRHGRYGGMGGGMCNPQEPTLPTRPTAS